MQWRLRGSPPEEVLTRLITRVAAVAAVALAVVKDFLLPALRARKSICLCSINGQAVKYAVAASKQSHRIGNLHGPET